MLERVKKREPSYTLSGNEVAAVTTENRAEVPQKTKNRTAI